MLLFFFFALKVGEGCIFCVFKSHQLFSIEIRFSLEKKVYENKQNFAACQNGTGMGRREGAVL